MEKEKNSRNMFYRVHFKVKGCSLISSIMEYIYPVLRLRHNIQYTDKSTRAAKKGAFFIARSPSRKLFLPEREEGGFPRRELFPLFRSTGRHKCRETLAMASILRGICMLVSPWPTFRWSRHSPSPARGSSSARWSRRSCGHKGQTQTQIRLVNTTTAAPTMERPRCTHWQGQLN